MGQEVIYEMLTFIGRLVAEQSQQHRQPTLDVLKLQRCIQR